MKPLARLTVLAFAVCLAFGQEKRSEKTDAQIRQAIIQQSIASYRGSCPCPYNSDRAGRRCGGRSAYSKPGGAAPLCYDKDVTKEMIAAYRKKTK